MSCCSAVATADGASPISAAELRLASRSIGSGLSQLTLAVPDIHCGACIGRIERALMQQPVVGAARVNLSTRRVRIDWRDGADDAALCGMMQAMMRAGYAPHLESGAAQDGDPQLSGLLRALGVAGFAAMNIMLLSVSVWSGADGATRDLFHWISALIAAPALAYSGSVFFRSALGALRAGQLNMDVPISLAVLLAYGMSLFEVANHGEVAYFDASVSLLFFLLAGRTLDHMMRVRARSAITGLARLMPAGAVVLENDGTRRFAPIGELDAGMILEIQPGERIPVDGTVVSGQSDMDMAVVNGESAPCAVSPGSELKAGTMNLTGVLSMRATASAAGSFIAEMMRLIENAENARPAYRRIADRASLIYAPFVHAIAAATFVGWLLVGDDWHQAMLAAIATLIITCPCALGLAVPMVQVAAATRLSRAGVLIKEAAALERLALVDTVVFDKTGTVTTGTPELLAAETIDRNALAIAAAMAARSNHPYSVAIHRAGVGLAAIGHIGKVQELPGRGLETELDGMLYKLGAPSWSVGAGAIEDDIAVALSGDGALLAGFRFQESLRPQSASAIAALKAAGLDVQLFSGDGASRTLAVAGALGIAQARGNQTPADKTAHIRLLQDNGRHVLMVGDGVNDAPALTAADVSMAPARASDIGRAASGLVFLHQPLSAVPLAIEVARNARRLILQNFALAVGYNMIAVPFAIAGLASPLVAAIAMSSSSLIVVLNAMRLHLPASAPRAKSEKPENTIAVRPAGSPA